MLQEFWHKNEELCELYRSRLGAAGYTMFQMGRTNDKGDGLFTAISSNHLRVLDMREIVFHDCGDRVAQLFHLQVNQSCMEEIEGNSLGEIQMLLFEGRTDAFKRGLMIFDETKIMLQDWTQLDSRMLTLRLTSVAQRD
jgi:hypothetical protein